MSSIRDKKKSNTTKVLINTGAQVLPEIVNFVSGMVLPRFMLLAFGSAMTGLVSSINQMLNYLKKMEAGLSTASAVNLYRPLAQKDNEKVREVVSASRHFYRNVGVLFTLGACILAAVYPILFDVNIDGYAWYMVSALVLILAGSASFNYFFSAGFQALLIADQKYYVVSLLSTLTGFLTIPCVLLAILTKNMLVVQSMHLLMAILQSILIVVYSRKTYKQVTVYTGNFEKTSMNMRWDVFINELALLVETNCPIIILTIAVGLEAVAVYSIYNMIFVALQSVIRISRDAVRPAFGQVWAGGDKESVKDCYSEFEWLIFFVTIIAYTITAVMIVPFVALYTDGITDANYIVPIFAILSCIAGAVRQLQIPASVMIGAAGKFKETRYYILTATGVAVVVGTIGAYLWGIDGVMVGVLCGTLIKTISTIVYINKKVLCRSMKLVATRTLRAAVVVALSVLPFITFIKFNPANYLEWIIDAIIVSLWTLLVALINAWFFDRKDMKKLVGRIFSAVRGK